MTGWHFCDKPLAPYRCAGRSRTNRCRQQTSQRTSHSGGIVSPTLIGVPIVKSAPQRGHGTRVLGVATIWRIATASSGENGTYVLRLPRSVTEIYAVVITLWRQ